MSDLPGLHGDGRARRRDHAVAEHQARELSRHSAVAAMEHADDDFLPDVAPLGQADRARLDAGFERDRFLVHVAVEAWNTPFDPDGVRGLGIQRRHAKSLETLPQGRRAGGLDVQVGDDGAVGFIKRSDLGRDRDEQRPERFQVGQKFDAMVTGFDRSKKPTFSIKAMQISEEKQAVAQYGSSDSGATLGNILGEALKARTEAEKK